MLGDQGPSLAEAAARFLPSLPPGEREASQQEVNKFIRWYGRERPIGQLTAPEVGSYAETMTGSVSEATRRLEPVRAFLAYAKKQGMTRTNLAVHLRVKKVVSRSAPPSARPAPEPALMTQEGYDKLGLELAALKGERPHIAEELRRAAADKDFRENAPLEAAREHQGQMEARIRELEAALKSAAIVKRETAEAPRARIGNTLILRELTSGDELRYTLVSPAEVNLAQGKISIASPTGKALLNGREGDEVKVAAPAGVVRYRIERVQP